MANSDSVREFLTSRRARITPEQAGLPAYGGNRRVSGLRREEVAMLAGVSVDYYTRLERGNLSGASDSVLEALARALQLNDAEIAHLYDLARAAAVAPRARRRRSPQTVRPSLQRVIDAITGAPAWLRNDRGDVLAANELGRALYLDLMAETVQPPNNSRFTFLNPKSRQFYSDWEQAADDIVAILRSAAGRNPYDKDLTDLVGELSTRSEEFRVRWARHDVKYHRTGAQARAPPDRRRPRPRLRGTRAARRTQPAHQRVHRRPRHAVRGRPEAARQLGGHAEGGHPESRRGRTRHRRAVSERRPPVSVRRRPSREQRRFARDVRRSIAALTEDDETLLRVEAALRAPRRASPVEPGATDAEGHVVGSGWARPGLRGRRHPNGVDEVDRGVDRVHALRR